MYRLRRGRVSVDTFCSRYRMSPLKLKFVWGGELGAKKLNVQSGSGRGEGRYGHDFRVGRRGAASGTRSDRKRVEMVVVLTATRKGGKGVDLQQSLNGWRKRVNIFELLYGERL
jgi:hypothetical protein